MQMQEDLNNKLGERIASEKIPDCSYHLESLNNKIRRTFLYEDLAKEKSYKDHSEAIFELGAHAYRLFKICIPQQTSLARC